MRGKKVHLCIEYWENIYISKSINIDSGRLYHGIAE